MIMSSSDGMNVYIHTTPFVSLSLGVHNSDRHHLLISGSKTLFH